MGDFKYDSVYPNHNADIDESQFDEEGAVRLENMCPNCGALALYARKSSIGYWIACASVGCDGVFNFLVKNAERRRYMYYKERGIDVYAPVKLRGSGESVPAQPKATDSTGGGK